MHIVDSYWTNYEKPEIVDRKTTPPALNVDLVKRINGRHGGSQTKFNWKGKMSVGSGDLAFPEELQSTSKMDEKLIISASSSLAAFYHRDQCLPHTSNRCSVSCSGLRVQISAVDLSETIKEKCNHSVQFGVAMDHLFTIPGIVTEDTEVVRDKIAYFCVFEKKVGPVRLNIRKEVDFLIPIGDNVNMPVEMKTRTCLGMNKVEFMHHLLPKLLTRCFLTEFYTVMIALREDKTTSSVTKVMFIEDVRDLAGYECWKRDKYFRRLFNRVYKSPKEITEIRFSQEELRFFNGKKDLLGNLARQFHQRTPHIKAGIRPDIAICLDPELEALRPTLCDMCVEKKWPKKESWRIKERRKTDVILVAWRFESLLDLLRRHEHRANHPLSIYVHLCLSENPPSEEEVEFVVQFHIGELANVEVSYYSDVPHLETLLENWDLYETCDHAMVLLGQDRPLPECFAIRCTDIFRITTFPLPVIIDVVTIPEKIAVFGCEAECLQAAEKLSQVEFLKDIPTYYFIMDKAVCAAIPLTNVYCVTCEEELRDILKDLHFPVVA